MTKKASHGAVIKFVYSLAAAVFLLCTPTVTVWAADGEIVGRSETLLTAMNEPGAGGAECSLGDAAADALRDYAGTDAALIPGGVFRFNLLGGDVTRADVYQIFPDDDELGICSLTAAQLWQMLEQSVSAITVGEGDRVDWERSLSDGFLQISGFRFRFDASSEPGQRVREVVLDDGRSLSRDDAGTVITAVGTAALFSGAYGYAPVECSALELTLPEAFIRYLRAQNGGLRMPDAARIEMIGTADRAFLSGMGPAAVVFLACAGAIALTGALTFGRSAAWKALKERVMPETEEEKKSVLNRFFRS